MSEPKRCILVYGNCQGGWLARSLGTISAVADQFDIVYLSDYTERPVDHPINAPDFLANCSVVIWQTASTGKRPWFLDGVPATCRQIRYPTLWLKLLWPTYAVDPRNLPEPNFPWGRYPYGDRLVMKLLADGVPAADLPQRYIDTDLNTVINLDRFTAMSLAELRFNDKQSDIAITPFLEANFRQRKLFGTVNHPTFLILDYIFQAVTSALLGLPAPAEMTAPANGAEVLGEEETPIHPQIISHFKLQWTDAGTKWRYHSAFLTLTDYLRAYATFTPIPIGNPPQLWLARAGQAADRQDLTEAQRLLLEGATQFPEQTEFLHYLGILMAKNGRLVDAEKVFRYALSRHPRVASLHSELGNVMLRQDCPEAAVGNFQEALRLDPQHKEARRNLILAAGRKSDKSRSTQPAPLAAAPHGKTKFAPRQVVLK